MSSTPASSMSAAEMKARVEAFEMLTKTSPFLMQYPPNMPLVNPFDPQAPLPGSTTNTNPLTLADVSMPSFQEMLKGPEAKQNAQQWSEYMRKRFAAQSGMCDNLQQRFDAATSGDNLSIPRAASLPIQSTSAPSTPGMTEKSTVPVGRDGFYSRYSAEHFLLSRSRCYGWRFCGLTCITVPAAATPPTPGFASLRRAHSEGDDLDITRATASQRAAFNVDKATESNNDTPLTTFACSNGPCHKWLMSLFVVGFTPLILAATGGHRDVVELLLNNGAQIEAQSERTKDTALSLACSGGRKDVVELLLSRGANKVELPVEEPSYFIEILVTLKMPQIMVQRMRIDR
ncbi:ankyrin repeat protein [Cooperia oncophora]